MSAASAVLAAIAARPVPTVTVGGAPLRVVVEDEAERIRDLPWADYADADVREAAVAWATARWSRGPDKPMQFREIQAIALLVAHLCDGAFLPIGTGWGKTIISLLAADALGARRPLLLIPPQMRIPLDNARTRDYAPNFKIPPNLRVMAYSQLSQASSTDILEKLAPDVIVCDEMHNLRHADAARTKRLIRYLRAHPGTRVVGMSGTLTSKSVRDYSHLAQWALKAQSPVPRPAFFTVLQAFCTLLDAKSVRADAAGNRYQSEPTSCDWSIFSPLFPEWEATDDVPERIEQARSAYMRRLLGSPGVVGTDTLSVGAGLYFVERAVHPPAVIFEHLEKLTASWERPDGEALVLALDVWRCGRQLSQGFYYRWRWPHPENRPDVEDQNWLRTRAAWHREVREVCKRNLPHLDSPLLVTMAARRALEGEANALARDGTLLRALEDWAPHACRRWHGRPTPPTETVWLDTFLLDDAVAWLREHPTGLIWYADKAIAEALAARKIPVFGPGTNPEDIAGAYGAALSIHVHKDGKNLQKHNENLFLDFLPSGSPMEQALSRTHRAGQEADDVYAYLYGHTEPARAAVASARNDAAYIQATMNTPQRLCYGIWDAQP